MRRREVYREKLRATRRYVTNVVQLLKATGGKMPGLAGLIGESSWRKD